MFNQSTQPFGKYTKLSIKNDKGTGLSLVPEYGACLLELSFSNHQVLDAYTTPAELNANRWFKNLLLFPFPNRMKLGKYHWEGKEYQFPINDTPTLNALHGFGYNFSLNLEDLDITEEAANLRLTYTYEGNFEAYPFPFDFELKLSINHQDQFLATMSFTNTGNQKIPIGWGWHPYFKLDDSVETLKLTTPSIKMVGIDQTMIPTGKTYDYNEFNTTKEIGATILDNCFLIDNHGPRTEIKVESPKGMLTYWQESGEEQYPYVQLFTPPSRESLAIEPMTCNVDAFNNGDGLIVLEAGETKGASFGLNFEAKM